MMELSAVILVIATTVVWYAAIAQQPWALALGLVLGAVGVILGLIAEMKEDRDA